MDVLGDTGQEAAKAERRFLLDRYLVERGLVNTYKVLPDDKTERMAVREKLVGAFGDSIARDFAARDLVEKTAHAVSESIGSDGKYGAERNWQIATYLISRYLDRHTVIPVCFGDGECAAQEMIRFWQSLDCYKNPIRDSRFGVSI